MDGAAVAAGVEHAIPTGFLGQTDVAAAKSSGVALSEGFGWQLQVIGQRFDLVILDTPPTKNALEFLETPSRAKTFFDERIIKWFIPNRRSSGLFGKVFDAGSVVLKLLGKIFGEQFVKELAEFFETLEFLQQALQSRGEMIDYIMRDEQTHFVVISSADPRRVKEALFFHEKLGELGQRADAFIINRVIPFFQATDLQSFAPGDIEALSPDQLPQEISNSLHRELVATYQALARLARRDRDALATLAERVGREFIQSIPMLGQDIHSIEQLLNLSEFLTPSKPVHTA